MNESNQIAKSAVLLTTVNIISILFSFIQEAVFANYFGTSVEVDAYTIAIQIPVTLFSVVTTAVQTIIIPIYSKCLYGDGKQEAEQFACNFISIISVITIIAVVICELLADEIVYIFSPGLEPQIHNLAVNMTRIALPTMIMTQLITVNTGIMNVHKSFILPALTSNILNTIFVVSLVVLSDKIGIYAAIFGNAFGIVVECIYSIIIRRRWLKYKIYIDFKDEHVKKSVEMMLPVFVGIGAAEINKVIDRAVASFLSEGSIASLNYASKLSSAVSSLLITGVSTVIYPQLAQEAAQKNYKEVSKIFNLALSFYLLLIIPIIVGGYFTRNELISLIFERGAFTSDSVLEVAPLFVCYLVCLLFTAFRQVSSRLFYSLGDSKTPMKNSLIGISFNIVLNVILAKFFGALGLAIATTVSTAIISGLILVEARKRITEIKYKSNLLLAFKSVVSSLVMFVGLYIIKDIIINTGILDISKFFDKILYTIIVVISGVSIYIGVLIVLRTKEVILMKNMLLRRKKA